MSMPPSPPSPPAGPGGPPAQPQPGGAWGPAGVPPRKKPAGMVWTGAVMVLLSIVGFIVSVAALVAMVLPFESSDTFPVPGSDVVRLEPGTYSVWLTNETESTGRIAGDVVVRGPSGEPVATRTPSARTTMSGPDSATFIAVAQFEAQTAGRYEIRVESSGATRAFVGPPLSAGGLVASILGVLGSGLLFLIGLILLIVGLVRRSRAGEPPAPQPAGGYGPGPGHPYAPAYPQPGQQAPPAYQPPPPTGQPVSPSPYQPPAEPQPPTGPPPGPPPGPQPPMGPQPPSPPPPPPPPPGPAPGPSLDKPSPGGWVAPGEGESTT